MRNIPINENDVLIMVQINGGFLPNMREGYLKSIWFPVLFMCEKVSKETLFEMAEEKQRSPWLAYVTEKDYDFLIYSYALNMN